MVNRDLEDGQTFEELCVKLERAYAADAKDCECCRGEPCPSCVHALGWHECQRDREAHAQELATKPDGVLPYRWRAGSLHNGALDVHSCLWAMARQFRPLDVLKEKLDVYIAEGHLPADKKDEFVETFEQMRGHVRQSNPYVQADEAPLDAAGTEAANRPMSPEELQAELSKREAQMQRKGGSDGVSTDQWRVYREIVDALTENKAPLRLFLQASAGTGKSFLLETVYMWAILKGHRVEACAPTGIAAARLRVPRTEVSAHTIHHLFGLNIELQSSIDPSKPDDPTSKRLTRMTLLIVDEISMIDDGVTSLEEP